MPIRTLATAAALSAAIILSGAAQAHSYLDFAIGQAASGYHS